MRELRSIKDGKVRKRQKGMMTWLLYFILVGVLAGIMLIYVISKRSEQSVVRDLPSGKIYTHAKEGDDGTAVSKEETDHVTAEKGKEPEGNPESFTFYKVLSSKDKEIVPLTGGDAKKAEEEQIKHPVQEKMNQIEKEIDKEIVKIERKDDLFTVQVAALSKESNAKDLVSRLKQLGYVSYIHEIRDQKGHPLFKVRVGKFSSAVDAQEVAKLLKKDGYDTYVVKAD